MRREFIPALALCIVAFVAIACGTSSDSPTASDTEATPTTAIEPQSDAPPLRPPGRGVAPGSPDGAGRISRFVPLDNPAIVGAESLIRWHHPRRND